MDHPRLMIRAGITRAFVVIGALFFSSCVTHHQHEERRPLKSFFASELSPAQLFNYAHKYLEFQKGYGLKIADPVQGLLVTEWVSESPVVRHQITLRVIGDVTGSMLSAHVVRMEFVQSAWRDIPSVGEFEDSLIQSIEAYIQQKTRLQ